MADAWLNAPSKATRTRIFKETGIRWSELLRLPYWDPTRNIVVDAMHNLFLGLVRFHIRTVLGMQVAGNPEEGDGYPPATSDEMAVARQLWETGFTKVSQLKKIKIPALLGLCAENEISLPRPIGGGERVRRLDITNALIVRLCRVR
jgi:hypothetical protein